MLRVRVLVPFELSHAPLVPQLLLCVISVRVRGKFSVRVRVKVRVSLN